MYPGKDLASSERFDSGSKWFGNSEVYGGKLSKSLDHSITLIHRRFGRVEPSSI